MRAQSQMEDRVHARLVAVALECGMDGEEALRYADSRMGSIEAGGIELGLAVDDLVASLRATAAGRFLDSTAARFAGWLGRRV